jgi:hypothetical protein
MEKKFTLELAADIIDIVDCEICNTEMTPESLLEILNRVDLEQPLYGYIENNFGHIDRDAYAMDCTEFISLDIFEMLQEAVEGLSRIGAKRLFYLTIYGDGESM